MATQKLASFEKRFDKCMLIEKVEVIEHFDTIFRKYIKETKDEDMKLIYKEAIEWCSKKRLQLIKELI